MRIRFILWIIIAVLILTPVHALGAEALKRGSRGDAVKALQIEMNAWGYDVGEPDGDFGARTEAALKRFQEDHGLVQSGILENTTYYAMFIDGGVSALEGVPPWKLVRSSREGLHRYEYHVADCSWEEANRRAVELGGYLVNINTLDEYVELQSEIQELGCADVAFWIGLRRVSQLSPGDFFWANGYGATYIQPVEAGLLFGGLNPWALDEPSYRSAEDRQEYYTCMRYSAGEARWVWDNCDGEVITTGRQGYIVEFDERNGFAKIDAGGARGALRLADEPEVSPSSSAQEPYKAVVELIEDNTVLAKVTATSPAGICFDFHDESGDEAGSFTGWVSMEVENRQVRFVIPNEVYEALPDRFTVYSQMLRYDGGGVNGEPVALTDWSEWTQYSSNPVDVALSGLPVYEPEDDRPKAYRTHIALASDPTAKDETIAVEIIDEKTGEVAATAAPGGVVYLKPGNYTARAQGIEGETRFVVSNDPERVVLRDAAPGGVEGIARDSETGSPVEGVEIAIEAQGVAYTTVTDDTGCFSFSGLPAVEAQLSAVGSQYQTRQNIAIGSGVERKVAMDLPLHARVTFIGHFCDGTQEAYDWFVNVFTPRCASGYYGEREDNTYYALLHTWYVEVEKQLSGYPIPAGRKLNIKDDGSHGKENGMTLDENPTAKLAKQGIQISGGSSGPLIISGTYRLDNTRKNNPEYDDYFDGWNMYLLDDITEGIPEEEYYRRLLDAITRNANPLEDELVRMLVEWRYADGGLNNSEQKKAMGVLESAPDKYRNLYRLSLLHYDIDRDTGEEGGSFFKSEDNTLYLDKKLSAGKFKDTFFHESAHATEITMWGTDETGDHLFEKSPFALTEDGIYDTLESDVRNHIREKLRSDDLQWDKGFTPLSDDEIERILDAFVNDDRETLTADGQRAVHGSIADDPRLSEAYRKVRDALESDIARFRNDKNINANMTSDIFGAVTHNKIAGVNDSGAKNRSSAGHDADYWENGDITLISEAWAEFNAAQMLNDQEHIAGNNEFFPKTMKMMEVFTDQLTEYYIDYYSGLYGA